MIRKRYEVRSRIIETGEVIPFGWVPFFFRRSAEKECYKLNCMRQQIGYGNWIYYVHDRRED